MLVLENLNYASTATVVFQRLSVIATEGVLVWGCGKMMDWATPGEERKRAWVAALGLFLSPGLMIIDHIHFQYNGMMYGLLLLSLLLAAPQHGDSGKLASGILFAVLLCFKHIYLYLAPAYFIFLLRGYCLDPHRFWIIRWKETVMLGAGVVGVMGGVTAPWVYWNQLGALGGRLFPFSRGLTHAFWAPNIWALYSFADRILISLAPKMGLELVNEAAKGSVTRGLVGDTAFAVLPDITPRATFLLTLLFQIVALMKLWFKPTYEGFLGAVTLCGYASFLWGWHVHEKAILLVVFPFRFASLEFVISVLLMACHSLLALTDRRYLAAFRLLIVPAYVSLFPLLFTPNELPIKTLYTFLYLIIFLTGFDHVTPPYPANSYQAAWKVFDRLVNWYMVGMVGVVVYSEVGHKVMFGEGLEFLPLMVVSVSTAVGVVGSWGVFGGVWMGK